MKLLDPFAGYRLACGHPYFHFSLFTCSWLIQILSDGNEDTSSADIEYAFELLRWGHFLLFALAIVQDLASKDSPIKDLPEKQVVEPLPDSEDTNDKKAQKAQA